MNLKGIRVLVLDGFGRQIPSILHELHKLGCISYTVNSSRLDVGFTSRYPQKRFVINNYREDSIALEEFLINELMTRKYDVVLPVLEESTEILLKNEARLKDIVKIACAPYDAFVQAFDKQKTMEICMRENVPCPITKTDDETLEEFLKKVTFPIAVKPRKGTGSVGFKCVQNKEELELLIKERIVIPKEYIIQEYIPQTLKQYSVYMFFDNNKQCTSAIVAEHSRWYPKDGGPGCFITTIDNKKMADDSIKMMQAMGWSGFCQSGLIMDPRDNTPKVLEVNGRIPAGIKICQLCEHNIVLSIIKRALGDDVDNYGYSTKSGVCLQYSQTDWLCCLHTHKWWKETPKFFFNKNTQDYIFSWQDPVPWFSYTIQHMIAFKKEMKKRKH